MGDDDGTSAVLARPAGKVTLALLGIAAAFLVGWVVITVVNALEPDEGCGSYGYGGYGCDPPSVRVTVEPSTDLVDRQTVTVRGTGFTPNTTFGAAQCDPTLGPDAGTEGCDLSTARTATTDGAGSVQLDMTVRRIIVVQGREVDCAVSPCIIGGATLAGTTPATPASAEVSFDPSVPPVPRLTMALTVDDVTTTGASGTVTCNRAAEAFLEAVVEQTKGGSQATAHGSPDRSIACEESPTEWAVTFSDGTGVLSGGSASYDVYASAYDGFESAEVQESGEVRISGGGPGSFEPTDRPGETVRVEVLGATSDEQSLAVSLGVWCDRPVPTGVAFVTVTQRVGLDTVTGHGFVEFGPCDGPTGVSVPVTEAQGAFAGGPAEVSADVQIVDFDAPDEEFFDSASTTAAVRLEGSPPPKPPTVVPNPGSRIVISGSTGTALSGAVTCEETAVVELFVEVVQTKGRTARSGAGYTVILCTGVTAFDVPLEGDLGSGAATASVYATAYQQIAGGEGYEQIWDDHQSASLRIRD